MAARCSRLYCSRRLSSAERQESMSKEPQSPRPADPARGGAQPASARNRAPQATPSGQPTPRAGGPVPAGAQRASGRPALFVLLCLVCLAVAGGYVALASRRADLTTSGASAAAIGDPQALTRVTRAPHVVFVSTAVGETYGKVALAPLDA